MAWQYNVLSDQLERRNREILHHHGRRQFLVAAVTTLGVAFPFSNLSNAADENDVESNRSKEYEIPGNQRRRPYAPPEALVPATIQRVLLRKSLELTNQLIASSNPEEQRGLVQQLQTIVAPPIPAKDRKAAMAATRRYVAPDLVLVDTKSFDILSGSNARAAMNMYTANLRFADEYVLTASPETRKKYIREYNQLPDVKQVVAADLDLRDLYRNQVQTKIEDAQAELFLSKPDFSDLKELLEEANATYDQWFNLISPDDIEAAKAAALKSMSML